MISLGSRDARKELGLGFGGGREMEDTELEEGEACSDHNNSDDHYDASMDPDITLSYIDEKIQDVLGHFQKDFEGGVSAENLGAKFGGYGSFLPAYQRSPVWSHPRTPPKVQQHNGSRSPNNSQSEVGRRGSISSLSAPQSGKNESASAPVVSPVAPKATSSPAVANKQPGNLAKENGLRYESINRKSSKLPDQKMLKVRIKVGSDNLSTRKNAAIYSGLGLDVSPSSSLDDSPSGSEGMFLGPQDSPFESPAHILRIMTSFPILGGILLSPLPGHLIHLAEKEKLQKGSVSLPVLPVCPENSGVNNGSDALRGDGKINRLLERNDTPPEVKCNNNRDSWSGFNVFQKKETDSETFACEELVSNTLKLPLLYNSYPVADSGKAMGRTSNISRDTSKGTAKNKVFSELIKDEPLGPMSTHEDTWAEDTKTTSAGKIWEEKKSGSVDSVSVYPRKDVHWKGEKLHDSVKSDSNISKGTKAASSELTGAPKQKGDRKLTYREHEGTKFSSGKERSSSEGQKKLKGNGNISEMPKDGFIGGSASVAKSKKSTNSDDYSTKTELEDSKLQKTTGKAGDRYRDFFGDIELEREEKQMSPPDTSYEDRQKDFDVGCEKSTYTSNNALRERTSGKKIDKLLTTDVYPKMVVAPGTVNGPVSDAAPATVPAAAKDNWVGCDKCQKWRLLPLGKNPNDLPEKWLCSMLNWLPGMNRCSFSEEETTNAVMALNQVPTLGSQSNMQSNPGGPASSLTSVGNQLDQNHQIYGSHALPSGKKKTYKDGPASSVNSMKKSVQVSVTNGSLNEVNQPSASESDFLKPTKSSDLDVENHKHNQKEKQKVLDSCSDGGDARQPKVKSKRDSQKDLLRVSKKIKAEGLPRDWVSDPVNIEKVGPSSSNGLPTMSSGKNLPKNNGRTSSEDQVSYRKPNPEPLISMDGVPMDMGKRDDRGIGKKRKNKESRDAQVNTGSYSIIGQNLQDIRILAKEELSGNEYRKEKKAKISRSDGKESSASKGSGKTDKKGSHRKSKQLGQDVGSSVSQRSLDGVDFLKKDSGSLHPSVAATSSSSKVSGSHKTKSNFHDTKGSPVESVSSSPLRVSKRGKSKSGHGNFIEKCDSTDAGCFILGGQKRCLDGEDDGGSDRSGTAKKEKALEVAHHGSFKSSVRDSQDKNFGHCDGKAKQQVVLPPDVVDHHFVNGADYSGQETRYSSRTSTSDRFHDDDRQQENHYHVDGSRPTKPGKGSSSRPKGKNRNLDSELENSKVKVSDSAGEQVPSYEVKQIDNKSNVEERSGVRSDESENRYIDKKDSKGLLLSDSNKKENQSKYRGHNGPDIKAHDTPSITKQTLQPDSEAVSARDKSPSLPPSGGVHNETASRFLVPVSGSQKGNGTNTSDSDNASKTLKQIRKVDYANGTTHNSSRDPLSNGHRAGDFDAPSPVKRDSSSQAATNVLKEAKHLKHLADRLKNSGSNLESTRLYFEAALKFLHGASLLETGDLNHSLQYYSSTAKLCEFCAHEYEKSKDMAAAALAYKCIEVAYMRVIYSSHNGANKDRRELQTALQMVPPGESPSSSASDVDNLNHPTTLDKGPLAKGVSSPQVTGSHVIAAQNRPNFVRLLKFAHDVNFAMEASRKSRIALSAANVNLGETQSREGISTIKTALDFNFQDVEGLLHLVRLAIEAISR